MSIRVFGVALSVVALWWSSSSFGLGLGLGEVNVASNLYSPLKASVTLRGMEGGNLDPGQFTIRVESESGSSIGYRLQRIDADSALIHLFTQEALSEPLVQFRVEVEWDRNSVARSYDAFVDPPTYQENFDPVAPSAEQQSSAAVIVRPVDDLASGTGMQPTAIENSPAVGDTPDGFIASEAPDENPLMLDNLRSADPTVRDPAVVQAEIRREYGPTISGNSIWRVARAVATDSAQLSIYQWMYAIWNSNPSAFMGNNMHRLRMGRVLRIPLETEVGELPHIEAWRAYSNQLARLKLMEAGKQSELAERAGQPVDKAPARSESPGQLQTELATAADENRASESANGQPLLAEVSPAITKNDLAGVDATSVTPAQTVDDRVAEDALIARLAESAATSSAAELDSLAPIVTIQSLLANNPEAVTAGNPGAERLAIDAEVDASETIASVEIPMLAPLPIAGSTTEISEPLPVEQISQTPAVAMPGTDTLAAAPTATGDAEITGWYQSLQSRQRWIESLPIIGAGGSLALIGSALQRTDVFIATSPSWAALAFGIWLALMLVMLSRQIKARRDPARKLLAGKLTVADAIGKSKTMGRSAAKQGAAGTDLHDQAIAPAESELSESPPEQSKRPPESNAHVIIAQAQTITANGDIEEAIKLMALAVELQPHQPALVFHLLELYHKMRRVDAFATLLNSSQETVEMLELDDLAQLQAMHARLLPGNVFAVQDALPQQSDDVQAQAAVETSTSPGSSDAESPAEGALVGPQMPRFAPAATTALFLSTDEEADLNMMATRVSESFSTRFDAIDDELDDLPDDDYVETQVIFTNNGVPLREESADLLASVDEFPDLDVTLKEADVYLAYGLYENAEELLLKGMEIDPERADFLARLLDTYYATQNVVDFVSCAEVMQDMGDEGREHWQKVEIMGFELAPYNKMFAAGKDRSLDVDELEIHKPETADFDFSEIEGSGALDTADIAIEQMDDAAAPTDLNLDLATGEVEEVGDDTLDELDRFLSLDTGDTPLPQARAQTDEDDISTFVLDDNDDQLVASKPAEEGHLESLGTAEILAIPAASEPPGTAPEADNPGADGEFIQSLETSEILAIPDTSESEEHAEDSAYEWDVRPENNQPEENKPEKNHVAEQLDQDLSLSTAEIMAITGSSDPAVSRGANSEDTSTFELDEASAEIDLDAVKDELEFDAEPADGDDSVDLDFDDGQLDGEAALKFTIEDTAPDLLATDELEPEAATLSVVRKKVADDTGSDAGQEVDGRILYFPENTSESRAISEFESDVKVTLQAIRDQLQHITERLFHQERETSQLQQAIAELKTAEATSRSKKKKSS